MNMSTFMVKINRSARQEFLILQNIHYFFYFFRFLFYILRSVASFDFSDTEILEGWGSNIRILESIFVGFFVTGHFIKNIFLI